MMRVRVLNAEMYGTDVGRILDVVAVWVFCNDEKPWHVYIAYDEHCLSNRLDEVEIIDGDLRNFCVISCPSRSGYQIVRKELAENLDLYRDLLECKLEAFKAYRKLVGE